MAEPTFEVFVQGIYKGTPEARLALAQQLKNAGLYSGTVSANLDTKYYTALAKLEAAYQQQVAIDKIVGATSTAGRYDILTNLMAEDGDSGGSGPKTTPTTYITSASQTAKLLDAVAEDLLERKLTKAERAKYTRLINEQQRKQPSVTTSGGGGPTTTRGGVDEEQFITDQIANTAEAKTNQASDAYTILMQELGGLR